MISLCWAIVFLLSSAAQAGADETAAEPWTLSQGRVDVTVHRWPARCGERPEAKRWSAGARYQRRGLALLPIDDAPPVFGSGICRAYIPAADTWETTRDADMACGAEDGSSARIALRQPSRDMLTVVHQVRRTPDEGCAADVVATWVLTRDGVAPPPADRPARAGSHRVLDPVAPPVTAPPPVPVAPRSAIEVSARVLPAPDPPVAGSRLPLFALVGLMVVIGVVGLVRSLRRAQ